MGDELKPSKKGLPAENVREVALAREAARMRGEGKEYADIAKALGLKKGWTEAYKLVWRTHGEAVAGVDKDSIRMREVGRLITHRAMLESRVIAGDEKAIELDLKYTAMISDIYGLKDAVVSGGSGGGVAVQINVAPPWEGKENADGPAPDVIEGEAVDEEPLGGVVS